MFLCVFLRSPRRFSLRVIAPLAVCLLAALLQSCAKPAHVEVNRTASDLGLVRSIAHGKTFQHVVYQSQPRQSTNRLHVYIEGDGVAWRMRSVISRDPTPRNPLMLRLMGMDPSNTLYVGRPCYFGLVPDKACNPDYWTFSRFSDKVVKSMASVIREKSADYRSVVLIGHSGGGALAMLIAEHLRNVDTVVTIAGNLDIEAWTKHHGYTPLFGSLNPAARSPLSVQIRQLHLVAGRDEVIPPAIVNDWIARQPSAQRWVFEEYDHSCCWSEQWVEVLRWISRSIPDSV